MTYRFPILFIILLLFACNHGLSPTGPESISKDNGISGTIFYQNWPPADSIKNLKLVVFKEFPPDDILSEAVYYPPGFSESLPQFVDSTDYFMALEPGVYEYIVVAQQYGGFLDWRAVGQYDTTRQDSLPTSVTILPGSVLPDINIYVDFENLPIQPI